jgi:hypothetical protein
LRRYCDFFSGSFEGSFAGSVAPEELEGALPEELDGALPLVEPLAPPEAEPELDFEGSDEGELGELGGVAELPPEGELDEDELEPELEGGVDDGDEELLLLPLVPLAPLPALPPLPLSWPQAARPRAMATATANVESFMCPPWLGIRKRAAKNGPGVNPLGQGVNARPGCRHFLLPGTSYLLAGGVVDFLDESGWLLGLLPGALLAPLEPDGLELLDPVEPPEAPPPAP